ncbi:hypothetical protein C8Q78DRAFT_1078416 [Trametes maxima]|nr:hypothetical protein C8Q78DRAFT_1078416 [Trametes maxima]
MPTAVLVPATPAAFIIKAAELASPNLEGYDTILAQNGVDTVCELRFDVDSRMPPKVDHNTVEDAPNAQLPHANARSVLRLNYCDCHQNPCARNSPPA